MVLGAFFPSLLWPPDGGFMTPYTAGLGVLVLSGLIDDSKGLTPAAKFMGQAVAALIVVLYGIKIRTFGSLLPGDMMLPDWVSIPLTVVVIVGVTNAINLADGLDGLAGGICLLSVCCIGYLAYLEENILIALLATAIAGCLFGFLRFNTYPAQLFMGDTGSQFLGFSVITLSLSLTQGHTALSPLLPLIILGFPILDTLTVMIERISEGRSPFSADNNHFHHRLMRLGFDHKESVLIIYVIQAFLIASAYTFRFYSDWVLLLGFTAFSGTILLFFFWADVTGWRRGRFHLLDVVIRPRFTAFRKKSLSIKLSFRVVEYGVPLLLLVTCFIPTEVPSYFSLFSLTLLCFLALVWRFKRERLKGCLMISLYLFTPFLVYFSLTHTPAWFRGTTERLYICSYVVLVFFVITTLKLTKRRQGFKTTPVKGQGISSAPGRR